MLPSIPLWLLQGHSRLWWLPLLLLQQHLPPNLLRNLLHSPQLPLEPAMRIKYADNANIEFLGIIDAVEVAKLLAGARFSIAPSQCYDNNPLSVVESLCAGTPVAGSHIGGIPELIDEGCGMTFTPFDQEAIATAIEEAMSRKWDHAEVARRALERFSPEAHMSVLKKEIYGF